jgi:hypothetical protein
MFNNIKIKLTYLQFLSYIYSMKNRLIIVIFTLIVTAINVKGQQPTVKNFTTNTYNGGTQNWCIAQTTDKRMLFGNDSGLMIFDSERWFNFPIANYTIVRSIYYDAHNSVTYAGGSNEFGYFKVDPLTYQVYYTSISSKLPASEKDFDEVWNIYRYKNNIVFQCKKHIFLLDSKGKISIYRTKYRIETSTVINNKIIIACKEALYYMKNGTFRILPNTSQLYNMSIRAIMPYTNGKILFASASNGIYIYDGKSTSLLPLDITPFLQENQIFCGATRGDMMAIGTVRGGLVVKNMKTGQNFYSNVMTGMQNNTVLSLFFDSRNNIWLGLDQGISYVLIDNPYKELFGSSSQYGTGYASMIKGNDFYLGTNQGLFITKYPIVDSPIPEQPKLLANMAGQVWCLRNINGTLLCGNNDGAYQIEGSTATKIPGPEGTWDFKLLHHHPGYLLSCDYESLYILKYANGKWVFSHRISGFNEFSASFEEDKDGTIWLSHWQKGIYHLWLNHDLKKITKCVLYDASNQLPTNENNIISNINGRIYISARDGFYIYNHETKHLQKAKKLDALFKPLSNPLRLFETPRRDIWAANLECLAIARFSPKGNYILDTLSYRDIAKRLELGLGHISFINDNLTIFNVQNGFLSVANNYHFIKNKSTIHINRIIGINGKDTILYASSPSLRKIAVRIPHSQNSIRIEFAWPEYNGEHPVAYSCYLENYDTHWNNQNSLSTKEYTHLQKGTYIFHVRGYNSVSGLTRETELYITILPAWYETWIAYIVYLILFAFAIYYIIIYIRYRYGKKIRLVEEKRERELKEQEIQFEIERQKKERELMKLKNEQLEIELKHKSSELADSTMNLIRKNDMLQSLDDDLNELSESVRRQEAKKTIADKIRNIHSNIQTNIREDDNWEKFEENFNLVYDNYMKKLTENFPQLTTNDRKLCAYLKMELSSKEIASLLNTSVRSIETARYRLRKKLDLTRGNNLTSFMQSLEKI